MNIPNQIFSFYDKLILGLPQEFAIILSIFIILVLIWSVMSMLKQGHWIYVLIIIVLFPGGFAAIKNIGLLFLTLVEFLFSRIIANF